MLKYPPLLLLQALPELMRVLGLQIPGGAFADLLMVQEFVHNFCDALELGKKFSSAKNWPKPCNLCTLLM